MPIKGFVKGITRKVREKFYKSVYSMTKAIGSRTEAIFTSLGIRKVTPDEIRKKGLSPDIPPETLIISTSISPFSSEVAYDPRFKRYIDQSTKRIMSKEEMKKRLKVHKRKVLLASAKQRKPELSDKDIIAIVDKLEADREKLKEALSREEKLDIIEALLEDIGGGLEELGVDSP